jgi:hypothetical protein
MSEKPKRNEQNRPDGLIFVIAYFALIAIIGVFGAFVLLVPLPHAIEMAQGDSLFMGGVAAIVITAIFSFFLGSAALWCIRGLWLGTENGRAQTIAFALILAFFALASIPALVNSLDSGSERDIPVGTAVGVIIASGLTVWYLLRPDVKAYFRS